MPLHHPAGLGGTIVAPTIIYLPVHARGGKGGEARVVSLNPNDSLPHPGEYSSCCPTIL